MAINADQRGIGFVISQKLLPYLVSSKQISDNVAFLDFKFPHNSKNVNMRVVNAYGPTSPSAKSNP